MDENKNNFFEGLRDSLEGMSEEEKDSIFYLYEDDYFGDEDYFE